MATLQCSCLENPKDSGAWWAAVHGVAQCQTWLKRLSSSSSSSTPQLTYPLVHQETLLSSQTLNEPRNMSPEDAEKSSLFFFPLWYREDDRKVWDTAISSDDHCFHHLSFSLYHVACWILVPWPGTEPEPLAVKSCSPNHWTAREFLLCFSLYLTDNQILMFTSEH